MAHDDRVLIFDINWLSNVEIARDCHWYCIPVRSASTRRQGAHLANNQIEVSAAARWAVNYCAGVLNHSGACRCDLLRLQDDCPWAHDIHHCSKLDPLPSVGR